ncbi:MAG: hypothetical protein ACLFU8_13275 [Anaerolineales bacterium]
MRRSPFRPGPRRPLGSRGGRRLPPVVRRALVNAQRLLDLGQHAQAAAVYDRLATEAYARGRVRAGVQMDLEAGRAYLRADLVDQAQARARRAVERSGELGHAGLVRSLVEGIVRRLEARGDSTAAQSFRAEMEARWETESPPPTAAQARTARLPAHCPACRAPLRLDEVEWSAEDRATCPFCGSVVVAA